MTLQLGIFLKNELSVSLVAFRGEAYVVELDFIDTGRGHILGQRDVVVLYLRIGWIRPHQLAVFAPGLFQAPGLHSQRTVIFCDVVITKERLARYYMHL